MKKGPASMLSHWCYLFTGQIAGRSPRRSLVAVVAWAVAWAVGLSGLVVGGTAEAAPVSVGLLGIDGAGVEQGMGQTLTDALYKHIPQLQGMRVEKSQQDLVEVKLVFGCTDENPTCMAKVGKSLGVNRLIYGSIRKQQAPVGQGGGLYTVAIKQLSVADSTVEKFITESVPPEVLRANNPQLDELVQRWLRVLLIEGLRGGLRVSTDPPGATVQLDGVAVGQSPLNMPEVDVGDHLLKIDLDGYHPLQRTIRIRGGQLHDVNAGLVRIGSGRAAAAGMSTNRILRLTSYIAAGLAGATFIATIGTWRGYISAQDGANGALDNLQRRLTDNGTVGQYRSFFTSSDQLSGCAQVAGLQGDADYRSYLDNCQRGNTLAGATTGLWVATGAFAVLSLATGLAASLRKEPATGMSSSPVVAPRPAPTAPTAQPVGEPVQGDPGQAQPQPAPAPSEAPVQMAPAPAQVAPTSQLQLIGISPAVGPDGAAVTAAFRF